MVAARGREKEERRGAEEEGERGREGGTAGLAWRASATIARGEERKSRKKRDGAEGRLFLQNAIGITFGVISVSSSYNRLNSFSRAAIRVSATPTSRFYIEARANLNLVCVKLRFYRGTPSDRR